MFRQLVMWVAILLKEPACILCISILWFPILLCKIDLENVQCLNEAKEGSGKLVFKSWDNRLDREMVSARPHSNTASMHFSSVDLSVMLKCFFSVC